MKRVPGDNREHKIKIYTLSTCGWCKKTKALLKSLGVEYEYEDIDLLHGEEAEKVRNEMRKYNPRISTPTIVIDDGQEVVIGHDEEKVRKVLGFA